ncbi:MAG: hypothetical protein PF484_05510 [Bacteroidales bacterium]|jgi:hypothetical protein|nr:hypothetical protein [Bacteroidales bacterium]
MSKKTKYQHLIIYFLAFLINIGSANSQEFAYDKVFFENSIMYGSYYFTSVKYSGKSWIKQTRSKLPVSDKYAFTVGNSLELEYSSSDEGNWSAIVLYDDIRGIDFFNPATHLSFWIHIGIVKDLNSLPKIALLITEEEISKEIHLKKYITSNNRNWQRVLIPLTDFYNEISSSNITGVKYSQSGVTISTNQLFIDQIELVNISNNRSVEQNPELTSTKGYQSHVDIKWKPLVDKNIRYIKIYRSIKDDNNYQAVGIQSPWIPGFTDFIGDNKSTEFSYRITFLDDNYKETSFSNIMSAKTKIMTDEDFLDMIQESNFRYYWEGAEVNSGLALENIPGRNSMIALGASGFGIMAIITGVERDYISKDEAIDRFLKIIQFLKEADRFHGVYPHFLDGETGKIVPFFGLKDNGGDLVETSFLMQGLLTARQYFDGKNIREAEIRNAITEIWNNVEWDWHKRFPNSDFLYWHWSPDQEWIINHKLIGWNETLITYFLAIASPTHSVPASMYYSGWASQLDEAIDYRSNWGNTTQGSKYINGNNYFGIELPVGVSNGGPLFFTHYSFLGLNPHEMTDKYVNYFENNKKIAQINQRYCIENPKNYIGYGEDCWGLTASDGPYDYSANEPKYEKDVGKMTPTGALASFPYTPEASMKALKNYYLNYGDFLYGYYGFRDAFSLTDNWCSPLFMGLNQAPITVMIENYRTGLLWNLFMQNENVQTGLKKLNFANHYLKENE